VGTSRAADVAPEIDRLVLAVNDAVDDARLSAAAGERIVDWMVVNQLGDFLSAGVLTEQIATSRSPYRPREVVRSRLHGLLEQGLVEHRGKALAATDELRPLIRAFMDARAEAAASRWRGHDDDVDQASRTAEELRSLASDDHVVAAAHRSLPAPDDPYLRLHSRLVTLRYVRQHDHVEAWLARGLTAAGAVAMTALWQGESVDASAGLSELMSRELASDDPPALTDAGRRMRAEIETDTNERAQAIFSALGESKTAEFLAALRRLPG
jgi:hypothetical protein